MMMNRTLTVAAALTSALAVGLGAFWVTRALTEGSESSEPWVVPLSEPVFEFDLDLDSDADVGAALGAAVAQLGLDGTLMERPVDWIEGPPSATELRDAFGLSDDAAVPDVGSLPWGRDGLATSIDLSARGLTEPPTVPGRDPSAPAEDDIWEGVDPELPFIARELGDDDLTDDDDSIGALGDGEGLDALLFRHWGVDWPGFHLLGDEPAVRIDPPGDPDFLDVCAATVDDVPLDCGDGMGGTVLALYPPLDVIAVAIDPGPRCDGMLTGDGIPVRMTFNRPFTGAELDWMGTSDAARRTSLSNLVPHPVGLAAYADAGPGAAVFHHCVTFPADPLSRTYELRIRAFAERDRLDQTNLLTAPPTFTDRRPPTSLEPLGDRRMLAHVPAREGGSVTAHLLVRQETDYAVHCDPQRQRSSREATDWGQWPGPGESVRIRPAYRSRIAPSALYDPAYDRAITYDLSFRPTGAGGRVPEFVLCLTWEQIEADGRMVVAGESHLIAPPQRPIVDVYMNGGGWMIAPEGTDERPGRTTASLEIRQTAEATNGTTWNENRRIINDRFEGGFCDKSIAQEDIERAAQERIHVCRFELTAERREILLGMYVRSSGRDGNDEGDHSRLVRLPGHPEHPLRRAGCPTACIEVHTAYGWLTEQRYRSNRPPDVGVPVTFVVSRDLHDRWYTAAERLDVERPDRPVLDTRATSVSLVEADPKRGIELQYVADRPVIARWFARPVGITTGWAADSGCVERRFPHRAATAVYRSQYTLVINDACALTSYRFALELTDEDGNRVVHGDLMTWMVASREAGEGLALDDAFVSAGWNPRLRTQGHEWSISTDVRSRVSFSEQKIPAGVYVGHGPPGAVEVRSLDWDYLVRVARNTFLQSFQLRVGDASVVHGRAAGDGKRCIDPQSQHGPRGRYVEVGDSVVFSGSGQFYHWFHGCPGHIAGRSGVFQTYQTSLPPDAQGRPVHTVPTALLEEAGVVTLVLHSGSLVPLAWRDRSDDYVIETIVTIRITTDTPRATTLRGEW